MLGTSRMSDWVDNAIRLNIIVEKDSIWYYRGTDEVEVYMIFDNRKDFDRWIDDLKKQADKIYKNKK